MGTVEIPRRYKHRCDGCGESIEDSTESRPKHWSNLTLARDAYDFQGCACADATIRRLLCGKCTEAIAKAINDIAEAIRASKAV